MLFIMWGYDGAEWDWSFGRAGQLEGGRLHPCQIGKPGWTYCSLYVKVLKRKCSCGPRFATNIFTTLIGLVSSPRRWSSCGSWSIRCWLLPLKAKNMKKYLCMRLQTETFFVNSIDCSSAWSGQRQYHSYHGAAFGSKGLRHLQVNNTVIIRFSDWFHLKLNIPLLKSFSF